MKFYQVCSYTANEFGRPIYYQLICLNIAGWVANSVDSDETIKNLVPTTVEPH